MVKARGSWSRSLTARVEVLGAFRDQNGKDPCILPAAILK